MLIRLARLAVGVSGACIVGAVLTIPRLLHWRLAARASVAVHRCLAFALGLRVEAVGALAKAPRVLVVANHVSWLDIVALGALEPVAFVAKAEVGPTPLARALLSLQGVLYVDRRRRADIPRANEAIAAAMRRGMPVVLFAEGTTGDGNRLLPLRSSHFEAACLVARAGEALVQPLFIDYISRAGLKVTRRDRPDIAWYGDMTFVRHFWRVMRGGRLACQVRWGEPFAVGEKRRKALTREAGRQLRELQRDGFAKP